MEILVKDFLKQKRFAVVGSFRNETKFAYRIFKNLIERGHEVFPVNPGLSEVGGRACYKSISDIPHSVDVANIVTPPLSTENILKECLRKGIKRVWLQPGAESPTAIQFCYDNGIKVIYSMCVLMESSKE
jgi:hypothetical protein